LPVPDARQHRNKEATHVQETKWSAEANGTFKSDHTYWKGFPNRTAAGLRLEQRKPL